MASEMADCPHCDAVHIARIKWMKQSLADNYGEVDQATYDDMKQKLEMAIAIGPPTETMEENFEHWFTEGKFKRRYNCKCEHCGWEFQAYTVEEKCVIEAEYDPDEDEG